MGGDQDLSFLLENDLVFPRALLRSAFVVESGEAVPALMQIIFAEEKGLVELTEFSIDKELAKTVQETTLFRSNSPTTKLLTTIAKMSGQEYLAATIGPQLRQICTSMQAITLIGDLSVVQKSEDFLEQSASVSLRLSAGQADFQRLLSAILNSTGDIPAIFHIIANILKAKTSAKFPNALGSALSGFLLLRFVCPAIVTPEAFGLLPVRRPFLLNLARSLTHLEIPSVVPKIFCRWLGRVGTEA